MELTVKKKKRKKGGRKAGNDAVSRREALWPRFPIRFEFTQKRSAIFKNSVCKPYVRAGIQNLF